MYNCRSSSTHGATCGSWQLLMLHACGKQHACMACVRTAGLQGARDVCRTTVPELDVQTMTSVPFGALLSINTPSMPLSAANRMVHACEATSAKKRRVHDANFNGWRGCSCMPRNVRATHYAQYACMHGDECLVEAGLRHAAILQGRLIACCASEAASLVRLMPDNRQRQHYVVMYSDVPQQTVPSSSTKEANRAGNCVAIFNYLNNRCIIHRSSNANK